MNEKIKPPTTGLWKALGFGIEEGSFENECEQITLHETIKEDVMLV